MKSAVMLTSDYQASDAVLILLLLGWHQVQAKLITMTNWALFLPKLIFLKLKPKTNGQIGHKTRSILPGIFLTDQCGYQLMCILVRQLQTRYGMPGWLCVIARQMEC